MRTPPGLLQCAVSFDAIMATLARASRCLIARRSAKNRLLKTGRCGTFDRTVKLRAANGRLPR